MSERWRRLVTIVNVAAGGGRCRAKAPGALRRLRETGFDPIVHYTERAGHAEEIARTAYAEGERRFLVVGGDGSAYEVVNGIFPRPDGDDDPVYLGQLPLGTGNSFMRDYGVNDVDSALRALADGHDRPADVVRAEHDAGAIHYINLLSIGFTADAGALMNRRFKSLGAAGYALATVATVATMKSPVFPLRLDGASEVDRRAAVFLSFSNSRYTGGTMMMAPEADPGDGLLDVIRVGEMGRFSLLKTFPKIYKGEHVAHPAIEQTQVARVDFEGLPALACMVDGEILTLTLRSLVVLPGALRVLA